MTNEDSLPPLEKLQEKIQKAKHSRKLLQKADSGMGLGLRLAVEMVSCVLVGAAIGYFIDGWLETLPLFMILFFFAGSAAGGLTMYRTACEMSKREEQTSENDTP